MDVYDITAHSTMSDGYSACDEMITRKYSLKPIYDMKHTKTLITILIKKIGVVTDLFSYDDIKRRRILDHYYLPSATFVSPILRTTGVHNIKQ